MTICLPGQEGHGTVRQGLAGFGNAWQGLNLLMDSQWHGMAVRGVVRRGGVRLCVDRLGNARQG